jgi:IS1 family transposase
LNLSDFNVTDEVQQVLWEAYQENLKTCREYHANRCTQLARQIAQATTRHDAEMKVLTDAFAAYQAQV